MFRIVSAVTGCLVDRSSAESPSFCNCCSVKSEVLRTLASAVSKLIAACAAYVPIATMGTVTLLVSISPILAILSPALYILPATSAILPPALTQPLLTDSELAAARTDIRRMAFSAFSMPWPFHFALTAIVIDALPIAIQLQRGQRPV